MKKKREIWIDDVKVIACILVVLGHFFQSMVKAEILQQNDMLEWFDQTIYFFHVPLFFICSGYLYQRYSVVNNVETWGRNILKKLLVLGIPYFTFSFATWLLKTVFASSTNDQIGGLFETLFLQPTAPYWYLYCLFFLFLVTPTFSSTRMALIGVTAALFGKTLILSGGGYGIYSVSTVLTNEVWFVFGMCLAIFKYKPLKIWLSILSGIFFTILSVWVYRMDMANGTVSFALGILACVAVVSAISYFDLNRNTAIFEFISKYTMPIFLMHTLFAAPFRVMLLKVGIRNEMVHMIGGIAISFVGPMIAAEIMKKIKFLELFLYPGKFIKL